MTEAPLCMALLNCIILWKIEFYEMLCCMTYIVLFQLLSATFFSINLVSSFLLCSRRPNLSRKSRTRGWASSPGTLTTTPGGTGRVPGSTSSEPVPDPVWTCPVSDIPVCRGRHRTKMSRVFGGRSLSLRASSVKRWSAVSQTNEILDQVVDC